MLLTFVDSDVVLGLSVYETGYRSSILVSNFSDGSVSGGKDNTLLKVTPAVKCPQAG